MNYEISFYTEKSGRLYTLLWYSLRKERKQFLRINVVDTESEDANNILNFCIIFMRGSHNFTIVTMLVKYV